MKKTILFLALAAITGTAIASEGGHNGSNGQKINASALSGSWSQSASGALAATGSQTTSITTNNPGTITYGGEYKLRSTGVAPDMIASPTAPCRIGVGISGGWVGGALGIGSSVLDEGCELRENARLLNNLGKQTAAVQLLCNDKKVAAVLPECAGPAPAPTEPQVSYDPVTKSTRVAAGGFVH
jgi:hypothetical protein